MSTQIPWCKVSHLSMPTQIPWCKVSHFSMPAQILWCKVSHHSMSIQIPRRSMYLDFRLVGSLFAMNFGFGSCLAAKMRHVSLLARYPDVAKRDSLRSSLIWWGVILPRWRCSDGKRKRKFAVVVKIIGTTLAGASLKASVWRMYICIYLCVRARNFTVQEFVCVCV